MVAFGKVNEEFMCLVKGLPFFLINTFRLPTNLCVNINSERQATNDDSPSSALETFFKQTFICHLMWKFAENFIIYSTHLKHMIEKKGNLSIFPSEIYLCIMLLIMMMMLWPSHDQCYSNVYNNKFFNRNMPININLLEDDTSKWTLFDGKVREKNTPHAMQLWSQQKKEKR